MALGLYEFQNIDFDNYKKINSGLANLIVTLSSSKSKPSSMVITGGIGAGKSSFVRMLLRKCLKQTPVQESMDVIEDSRVVFVQPLENNNIAAIKFNIDRAVQKSVDETVYVFVEEAHSIAKIDQYVFLEYIDSYPNIVFIFVTSEFRGIIDPIRSRSVNIDLDSYRTNFDCIAMAEYLRKKASNKLKKSDLDRVDAIIEEIKLTNTKYYTPRDIIMIVWFNERQSKRHKMPIYSCKTISDITKCVKEHWDGLLLTDYKVQLATIIKEQEHKPNCNQINPCTACHNKLVLLKTIGHPKCRETFLLMLSLLK